MRVNLKCFSHVKYALERDELNIELPEGSRAADLEAHVRGLAGQGLEGVPLRVSVNRRFVEADHVLAEDDEVALIPPVQGG